jgi:putative CocE/NonD family hydrolase
MRTGWHDIFLPWMLRDHATLTAAGNQPRLTIGPWGHSSVGLMRGIPRETIDFLSERLLDAAPRTGGRVRYHVTGAGEWRDANTWPPPGIQDQDWSLRAVGEFAAPDPAPRKGPAPDGTAAASVFRYDPLDPTPAVGGPAITAGRFAVDNRELEQRPDVLVFTSPPLTADLDVIGTPRATLTVSADNRHHDVFVRLCDVHPDGTSLNVSDRLVRLDDVDPGPAGVRQARLELWPTAHRFAAGHRLRVQVSAGAHPRYARNLGAGEPLATATATAPSTITVHHDDRHLSTLTLPIGPQLLI